MNALVFRAALRATVRVAFTCAIVGCGGRVVEANGEASKSDAAAKESSAVDNAPMCNAPPPSTLFGVDAVAGDVSESMFDCCIAELAPLVGDGPGISDAAARDPELAACCGVVISAVKYVSEQLDAGPAGVKLAQAYVDVEPTCCEALADVVRAPGCEGWGPPMPPALSDEASAAA
jgi:hypothetical protein